MVKFLLRNLQKSTKGEKAIKCGINYGNLKNTDMFAGAISDPYQNLYCISMVDCRQ